MPDQKPPLPESTVLAINAVLDGKVPPPDEVTAYFTIKANEAQIEILKLRKEEEATHNRRVELGQQRLKLEGTMQGCFDGLRDWYLKSVGDPAVQPTPIPHSGTPVP